MTTTTTTIDIDRLSDIISRASDLGHDTGRLIQRLASAGYGEAAQYGSEWHLIPDPDEWWCGDDGYQDVVVGAEDGDDARCKWVESYDRESATQWVDVRSWRQAIDQSGSIEQVDDESDLVEIEPIEPDCPSGEHDWQAPHDVVGGIESNPGVWGHGAGVVIREVCVRCGCGRTTDTWAQCGAVQGLRSIEYVEDAYLDDILPVTVQDRAADSKLTCVAAAEAAAWLSLAIEDRLPSRPAASRLSDDQWDRLSEAVDRVYATDDWSAVEPADSTERAILEEARRMAG